MVEWVNVFEKAVLDMKAEGIKMSSSLNQERQERVLGAAGGEYEFAAFRGALIKLFPDTIISQEKRSVSNRSRVM